MNAAGRQMTIRQIIEAQEFADLDTLWPEWEA